ncbi:hypothetical protein TNCV_2487541 [Trichonephila clavipes]|uniref:Transposase n=1 Tax=Trichonephila clavipes TaxID=2585209 RepID=A0A8X6W075_TRICX|nr:hypothetical protein TNCV_2487541 [Trichonephila clavipes]
MGMSATKTYKLLDHVYGSDTIRRKVAFESGINVSEKAGKVSKTMDTLDVSRLPAPLRSAVQTIALIAKSVGISEATCERILAKYLSMHRTRNSVFYTTQSERASVSWKHHNLHIVESADEDKSELQVELEDMDKRNVLEILEMFRTLQVVVNVCCCPSCQGIYSFGLAIHQNDHQARRRFVEWAQNEIAVVPDFHKRILFSDEAHFWLNGYVNKQNCRIWSEANPQVYVETPLHPEKLTVWCAL